MHTRTTHSTLAMHYKDSMRVSIHPYTTTHSMLAMQYKGSIQVSTHTCTHAPHT